MSPGIVVRSVQADLEERTPTRPFRFPDQFHPGLLRRPVPFLRIALNAGANQIFPRGRPTPIPRNHMVNVQILSIKYSTTVLTGVFIPKEDVVPGQLHLLLRHSIKKEEQDDPRNPDLEGDRPDCLLIRRSHLGEITPLPKRKGLETSILRILPDNLSMTLEEQNQGPPNCAYIDCLPQPVKDQDRLIQQGFHLPSLPSYHTLREKSPSCQPANRKSPNLTFSALKKREMGFLGRLGT